MKWRNWKLAAVVVLAGALLCSTAMAERRKKKASRASRPRAAKKVTKAKAAEPAKGQESERKVQQGEVPEAALKTLKKLAGDARITEFAEEIEHGSTFYEGSWKSPSGSEVDVLVTADGALVEIEEAISADKVPAAVAKAARRAAGKGAKVTFEKKTLILYEIKFSKGDSRHEILLTPDGRVAEKEVEKGKTEEEEEGDGDGDGKGDMKANLADDDDDEDDDEDDEDEDEDDEDEDEDDDEDDDDDDDDEDDEDDDEEDDEDEDD